MREIKFRGKRIDNGEWVYGWYFESNPKEEPKIQNFLSSKIYKVHPESVGQYTGLKAKGIEIYEGDIISECTIGERIWEDFSYPGIVESTPKGIVIYDAPSFNLKQEVVGSVILDNGDKCNLLLSKYDGIYDWDIKYIEIIGNIHENSDLLKENI